MFVCTFYYLDYFYKHLRAIVFCTLIYYIPVLMYKQTLNVIKHFKIDYLAVRGLC